MGFPTDLEYHIWTDHSLMGQTLRDRVLLAERIHSSTDIALDVPPSRRREVQGTWGCAIKQHLQSLQIGRNIVGTSFEHLAEPPNGRAHVLPGLSIQLIEFRQFI